jgi:hypothetical protein
VCIENHNRSGSSENRDVSQNERLVWRQMKKGEAKLLSPYSDPDTREKTTGQVTANVLSSQLRYTNNFTRHRLYILLIDYI